jgi:uncharacterized protein
MIDYVLLSLSFLAIILGLIGCLVPVLPGPPLSFLGILFLHLSKFGHYQNMASEQPLISNKTLIIFAAMAVFVSIFDYLLPIWGTKKLGGSKYGTRGATIGLFIGFFFGPAGVIIGPLLGAFVGEMIFKDDFRYALKAGLGSLVGFLTSIGLKLAASSVMTYFFIRTLIL